MAESVLIPPLELQGVLRVPQGALGTVVFAHGSGSSRLSPRNNYVAEGLARAGVASLLCDLLSPTEEADRANVFDIGLLAERLAIATDWIGGRPELRDLPLGYFGSSTGAAAALAAAAMVEFEIAAVVSRGGRPDLTGRFLDKVRAPTLLIVGGRDPMVLELNRAAMGVLRCEKELVVIPGAGHLFEEPGALDAVIDYARRWFVAHMTHEDQTPAEDIPTRRRHGGAY